MIYVKEEANFMSSYCLLQTKRCCNPIHILSLRKNIVEYLYFWWWETSRKINSMHNNKSSSISAHMSIGLSNLFYTYDDVWYFLTEIWYLLVGLCKNEMIYYAFLYRYLRYSWLQFYERCCRGLAQCYACQTPRG